MGNNELKPCPFCGGEAIIHHPTYHTVAVICSRWECGATVSICDARNIDEVVERWNRRADNGTN